MHPKTFGRFLPSMPSKSSASLHTDIEFDPNATVCFPYIAPFPYRWPNSRATRLAALPTDNAIFFSFETIFAVKPAVDVVERRQLR